MIKLVAISDTHTEHYRLDNFIPKDADIVVHAGDFSSIGREHEVDDFLQWFEELPNPYKIFISGNHDFYDYKNPEHFKRKLKHLAPSVTYLKDELVEIEGLKIWGRPWTPTFGRWAFMCDRGSEQMKATLAVIPAGVDILLTHGPAYGILDKTIYGDINVGCADLLGELDRIKPKYLIFGHIHEEYGIKEVNGITHVNAAFMDVRYRPINPPHILEIDNKK